MVATKCGAVCICTLFLISMGVVHVSASCLPSCWRKRPESPSAATKLRDSKIADFELRKEFRATLENGKLLDAAEALGNAFGAETEANYRELESAKDPSGSELGALKAKVFPEILREMRVRDSNSGFHLSSLGVDLDTISADNYSQHFEAALAKHQPGYDSDFLKRVKKNHVDEVIEGEYKKALLKESGDENVETQFLMRLTEKSERAKESAENLRTVLKAIARFAEGTHSGEHFDDLRDEFARLKRDHEQFFGKHSSILMNASERRLAALLEETAKMCAKIEQAYD